MGLGRNRVSRSLFPSAGIGPAECIGRWKAAVHRVVFRQLPPDVQIPVDRHRKQPSEEKGQYPNHSHILGNALVLEDIDDVEDLESDDQKDRQKMNEHQEKECEPSDRAQVSSGTAGYDPDDRNYEQQEIGERPCREKSQEFL